MSGWSVMTRTRGGMVSLMKGLTMLEARAVMQRLRRPFDEGNPWSDYALKRQAEDIAAAEEFARQNPPKDGYQQCWSRPGRWHTCSDSDLEQIECWGPKGESLTVWPKPRGADAKYERFLAIEREAVAKAEASA